MASPVHDRGCFGEALCAPSKMLVEISGLFLNGLAVSYVHDLSLRMDSDGLFGGMRGIVD